MLEFVAAGGDRPGTRFPHSYDLDEDRYGWSAVGILDRRNHNLDVGPGGADGSSDP